MTGKTAHKIAIIQGRMSSSRLPGKVLMEINDRPMLQHVIERSMRARLLDGIVVATSSDPSDDILEQFCNLHGIPCYRGSLSDVLDRFYQAARQFHADVVIRLTADCPLIDPTILDRTISAFFGTPYPVDPVTPRPLPNPGALNSTSPDHSSLIYSLPAPLDFCANRLPPPWKRTIPIGLDVEVCAFEALEHAWQNANQLHQREHVMPYLYQGVEFTHTEPLANREWFVDSGTTPLGWRVGLLNHDPDLGSLRWTVDTPDDLEFVRQVYTHFGAYEVFGWQQVLALLESNPELAAINAGVEHKSAFDVDQRTASQ
jgi:spore coat polysaccharide biosynthesis protein SpsF